MKLSTIHSSSVGEVINPSSATGFRFEDEHGNYLEVKTEANTLVIRNNFPIRKTRHDASVQLISMEDYKTGVYPVGIVIDDPT